MKHRTVNSLATFGLVITFLDTCLGIPLGIPLGIGLRGAYAEDIVDFNQNSHAVYQKSAMIESKASALKLDDATPIDSGLSELSDSAFTENSYPVHLLEPTYNPLDHVDPSLKLTDEQLAWLAQNRQISVCPDANYAPIEMIVDGQFTGLSRDYIDVITQKTGLSIDIEQQALFSHCYQNVVAKKSDIIPFSRKTADRTKHLYFSKPYLELKTAIITSDSQFSDQELTIDDLHGKKVAVVKGYFWQEVLQKDHPQIEIVEVDSIIDGLTMVSFGSADAMFASNAVVTHYIEEHQISNLKISGLTPYDTKYRIGVRKDWQPFVEIVDTVLDSMSEEEHKAIKDKWIKANYYLPWYNKRLVMVIAIIIPFILFIGGAFMVSLRRQVAKKTLELKQKNMELAKINENLEKMVAERTKDLQESNKKLKQQSEMDNVAQIANRHHLNIQLESIFDGTTKFEKTITAFMIDVDYFKPYNDTYGHLKGDEVLYKVAQALKSLQRNENDVVARFGGEEFTIVCLDMQEGEAKQYAQQILDTIIDLDIEHTGSKVANHLTVSIGFHQITTISESTPHQLLDLADEALYQAKLDGRNTFVKWQKKTISI